MQKGGKLYVRKRAGSISVTEKKRRREVSLSGKCGPSCEAGRRKTPWAWRPRDTLFLSSEEQQEKGKNRGNKNPNRHPAGRGGVKVEGNIWRNGIPRLPLEEKYQQEKVGGGSS